jgi:TatD DNase family protein
MFIDSHCHLDRLDLKPYGNDFGRFMQETAAAGISHMLCVAINMELYPAMRQLVDPYSSISVSVGVHPNETDGEEPDDARLLVLAQDSRVVAVGETGLDYYRSEGDLSWQHERFRRHIRVARQVGKPLIIHTRMAQADTLRLLKEEGADAVGGVMHCFTEDWDTARQALDLGFYISFSGIVTFASAAQIQDVAKRVPETHYMIETDSPYLAPTPYRGKPNYPAYVRRVAEFVGDLRGIPTEEVARQSGENYRRLFG